MTQVVVYWTKRFCVNLERVSRVALLQTLLDEVYS